MPGFALKFAVAVLVMGLLLPGHLLAQSNTVENEARFWAIAEESGSPEQYEYYLERFPDGICSDLAHAWWVDNYYS